MQLVPADVSDALAARSVVESYQVVITLPEGPYSDCTLAAQAIQVDGSLVTDAPPSARLQPGYSSRSSRIAFRGMVDPRDAKKTAAWLFGYYKRRGLTASPMLRHRRLFLPVQISHMTYRRGTFKPYPVVVFTGHVDDIQIDPLTGEVTLQCLDNRNKFRGKPHTPPVQITSLWNAGLTSEYVFDYLLRTTSNYVYGTWPAVRDKCVLAVGFRTSLWPEVGTLLSVFGQPSPTFAPGPYGSGLQSTRSNGGYSVPQYGLKTTFTNGRVFVEFFVSGLTATSPLNGVTLTTSDILSTNSIDVGVTTTGLRVAVNNGLILLQAVTIDSGIHYVAFEVVLPPLGTYAATAVAYLDGASWPSVGVAADPWDSGAIDTAEIVLNDGVYAGLQVTTETAPVPNNTFTPKAHLDPSENTLTIVPPINDDAWTTFQSMCAAEQGVAILDENDEFWFKNRTTLLGTSTSKTLTSQDSLASLQSEESASALFNHVKARYTPWVTGKVGIAWQAATPIEVPAGKKRVIETKASDANGSLFVNVDTVVNSVPNGAGSTTDSGYRASIDVAGTAEHPGLEFTVEQLTSDTFRITVRNRTAQTAWLVSPAKYTDTPVGTPYLQICGRAVNPGTAITVDRQRPQVNADGTGGAVSDPLLGDQLYVYPDSDWRQDEDSATRIADDALAHGYNPAPTYPSIGIKVDPTVQLADRAHLVDDDASGMDDYVTVWGNSLAWTDQEWTQRIQGTSVSRPSKWILGLPGRSRLGVSTNI